MCKQFAKNVVKKGDFSLETVDLNNLTKPLPEIFQQLSTSEVIKRVQLF